MRDRQAHLIDDIIAVKQDIEVERSRDIPFVISRTARFNFHRLQEREQFAGGGMRFEGRHSVGKIRCARRHPIGRCAPETRHCRGVHSDLRKALDGVPELPFRLAQVRAEANEDAGWKMALPVQIMYVYGTLQPS